MMLSHWLANRRLSIVMTVFLLAIPLGQARCVGVRKTSLGVSHDHFCFWLSFNSLSLVLLVSTGMVVGKSFGP